MNAPFSHLKPLLITLLFLTVPVGAAVSQIPANIAFQGLLTDESGTPLPTGDYSISFRIYNTETGGTALWTEVQSVSVVDGIGNATLGRINPLDLAFDEQYWLGITIGQNPTELSPRIQMNAAAYAQSARGVADGAVTESKIADDAVTSGKIAADAVTSEKIANNSITGAKLDAGAVNNAAIENDAVTPDKINTQGASGGQTLVFNQGELSWGAPSGEGVISEVNAGAGLDGGGSQGAVTLEIAQNGIGSSMISEGAINTDHLSNQAVTSQKIARDAVVNNRIPVGEITLNRLNPSGASEGEIVMFNGTVASWQPLSLPDGTVDSDALADGAVTATKIFTTGAVADEVLTFDGANIIWEAPPGLGLGSVGTDELEDAAVTTQKIANGAVASDKVADLGVTTAKLADDAVTTAKLDNGAVATAKLANSAVATNKIEDGAVTGAKIGNGAVDTQQLANSAVTSAKLGAASVGLPKIDVSAGSEGQVLTIESGSATWSDSGALGVGSVGENELADNSVSTSKIQTGAVTAGKIDNMAVGNAALADGAVTNAKIAPATIDPLNKLNLTGASANNQLLVFNGGALNWTNSIPGNLTITGDLTVDGAVSKSSGSFKIDHPLDPKNKYLYHSFVESDEMMNVYSGNVDLDEDGRAVVRLPEWFEAANKDHRYQLTCIGGYAPVYIEQEIENGTFTIAGGTPNLRVSWQITAVRDDPLARVRRIRVEVDKPADERGKYLHPEVYE